MYVSLRFYIKHFWLVIPLVSYLILFLLHKKIQLILGLKCEKNFIVYLDELIFGANGYLLMGSIQHWSLDFLCATLYLTHYILPFMFLVYLRFYKKESKNYLKFIVSYGMVNFVCVIIQYLVPTPPPWLLSNARIINPEANFVNIDALLHINLFKRIYSNSPLVCGAFPSVHTAWPTVILFLRPWISTGFSRLHVILIGFAAVYSGHHYFIDVLFGFAVACLFTNLSIFLVDKLFNFQSELKSLPKFPEHDLYVIETILILKISTFLMQNLKRKIFNEANKMKPESNQIIEIV